MFALLLLLFSAMLVQCGSVRVRNGLSDAEANVGRLFQYRISATAFTGHIQSYDFKDALGGVLPDWLNWDGHVLFGIPNIGDIGPTYVTVRALGRHLNSTHRHAAEDVFSIRVKPSSQCKGLQQVLTATLVRPLHRLFERRDLLIEVGSLLNISPEHDLCLLDQQIVWSPVNCQPLPTNAIKQFESLVLPRLGAFLSEPQLAKMDLSGRQLRQAWRGGAGVTAEQTSGHTGPHPWRVKDDTTTQRSTTPLFRVRITTAQISRPNQRPQVVGSIGLLHCDAGLLCSLEQNKNLFEDDDSLSYRLVPSDKWLAVKEDGKFLRFKGLQIKDGTYDFQLIAEDEYKQTAQIPFQIKITSPQNTRKHSFSAALSSAISAEDIVKTLSSMSDRSDYEIRLFELSDSQVKWQFTDLPDKACAELNNMLKHLQDRPSNIFYEVKLVLPPGCQEKKKLTTTTAPVTDEKAEISTRVTPTRKRPKTTTTTLSPAVIGAETSSPKPVQHPVESQTQWMLSTVLPAIIIVLLLLIFFIIACFLYRRRKKNISEGGSASKRNVSSQQATFMSKPAPPVIFPSDYPEDDHQEATSHTPMLLRHDAGTEQRPPLPTPVLYQAPQNPTSVQPSSFMPLKPAVQDDSKKAPPLYVPP